MKKLLLSALITTFLASSATAFTHEFIIKGRGGMLQLNESIKTGSKGNKANQKVKDGWLGELAMDYLFTQNIAAEVAVGYGLFDVQNNKNTKRSASFVPITGTVMFRLPMYDRFFPYVGAGYSYRIISGTPKDTKIDNSNGVVLQAGADIFFEPTNVSNPMGINIDLKYYLKAKNKITETNNGSRETFSNDMSVFTIMGGVVMPF